MPVGGQEALIVAPRGVQVGPGTVSGVITPRSLVHGGAQDEEEEEERCGCKMKKGKRISVRKKRGERAGKEENFVKTEEQSGDRNAQRDCEDYLFEVDLRDFYG